jgi:dynactin complex subunit
LQYLAAANEDARFGELRDENAALRGNIDAMTAELEKMRKMVASVESMQKKLDAMTDAK